MVWALDTAILPDRSSRHRSGVHEPIAPDLPEPSQGLGEFISFDSVVQAPWPDRDERIQLIDVIYLRDFGWTPELANAAD